MSDEYRNGPPVVGIIMGSDSDLPLMNEACKALDSLQIPYRVDIVSAHRTPLRMVEYAQQAGQDGIKVIIAGAGGAAHLPGMVASLTTLPVIGVPVRTASFSGLDSLLSILQMPRGVPVATVAVQNAENAALLAARILGVADSTVRNRVQKQLTDQELSVRKKSDELARIGPDAYLERYF